MAKLCHKIKENVFKTYIQQSPTTCQWAMLIDITIIIINKLIEQLLFYARKF